MTSLASTSSESLVKKDTLKTSGGLKKCFTAIIEDKKIILDLEALKLMLKKELSINMDSLERNLSIILPYMLVIYMKTWPGWMKSQDYFAGKLKFEEWFEKFRQYIRVRVNQVMANDYKIAYEEYKKEKKEVFAQLVPKQNSTFKDQGTLTDFLAPKGLAPFSISVECSPMILNSLVFAESEDNIIIKQHPHPPWQGISLKQLLNWPYIEVLFQSQELSFKRSNQTEYKRYICFSTMPFAQDKVEFIEEVDLINSSETRKCYTLNFLHSYLNDYLVTLHAAKNCSKDYLSKIEIILNEFLTDLKDIGINDTMATNTKVVFNIGKSAYLRNKKITKPKSSRNNSLDIGYFETIIPKMETSLIYFTGVQDLSTNKVSFSYLNELKASISSNDNLISESSTALPKIMYRCTFCNVFFDTDEAIITHLEMKHKMEQGILCIKCKKTVTVQTLSAVRWVHDCSSRGNQVQQSGPRLKK